MKKVSIFLVLLVLASLSACRAKPYSFKESTDDIDTIEIVWAENILEYTVKKELSETEKADFLEQFLTIPFQPYIYGDPMSVHGDAVKITYLNGDYEIICHHWAEYMKDGSVYSVRKNADDDAFDELLEKFLE